MESIVLKVYPQDPNPHPPHLSSFLAGIDRLTSANISRDWLCSRLFFKFKETLQLAVYVSLFVPKSAPKFRCNLKGTTYVSFGRGTATIFDELKLNYVQTRPPLW